MDTSALAADWREASRRSVDEIISRIRFVGSARAASKETVCPGCSYITRSVSFPAQCIYCGGPLSLL
ncbi:MAG TPA: hypothetical protein VHC46_01830 [Thermodesulfobacteriota bacterium]|nr:hypothetical protein [Thermodesulfobacteriota bacterium]